jgi:hypothetical protein
MLYYKKKYICHFIGMQRGRVPEIMTHRVQTDWNNEPRTNIGAVTRDRNVSTNVQFRCQFDDDDDDINTVVINNTFVTLCACITSCISSFS